MQKIRFITALQLMIIVYLILTCTSIHAKSTIHNLYSADSLYKGVKINLDVIKTMSKLQPDQLKSTSIIQYSQSANSEENKIETSLNTQLYIIEQINNKNILCKNVNKNYLRS